MLVLQGVRWLREQCDVIILSIELTTRYASFLMEHQMRETVKSDSQPVGQVDVYCVDFVGETNAGKGEAEVERVVRDLVDKARQQREQGRPLCVIVDEIPALR